MKMLGYPNYLMNIVGVAKILAAIALLQPKFRLLKECIDSGKRVRNKRLMRFGNVPVNIQT